MRVCGVKVLNLIWNDSWKQRHFFDLIQTLVSLSWYHLITMCGLHLVSHESYAIILSLPKKLCHGSVNRHRDTHTHSLQPHCHAQWHIYMNVHTQFVLAKFTQSMYACYCTTGKHDHQSNFIYTLSTHPHTHMHIRIHMHIPILTLSSTHTRTHTNTPGHTQTHAYITSPVHTLTIS